MQVTVKRHPKSRIELVIELPADKMADFFASAYQELAQQADIPGFRRGKAPKPLIKDRFGEQRIIGVAVEQAIPLTYHAAITKEGFVPVAEPTIHVDKVTEDGPFIFRAAVDVLPEVQTGHYRKLRVAKKKFAAKPVDLKEVEAAIERVRKAAATPKSVDRPAAKGDWVEVSYTGTINGVPQDNLKNNHHPFVIGEGAVLPAFEEHVIDMCQGEKKTFTIDIPQAKEKQQRAVFELTLTQVSELVLPTLDDALAKRFGKASVTAMRTAIQAEFQAEHDREAVHGLEEAVLELITKQARVELPGSLIEREIERRIEMLTEQLSRSGRTLDRFLQEQKKDLASFKKELYPAAEQAVKTGLVLRAIADSEGLVKAGESATPEVLEKTVKFLVEEIAK